MEIINLKYKDKIIKFTFEDQDNWMYKNSHSYYKLVRIENDNFPVKSVFLKRHSKCPTGHSFILGELNDMSFVPNSPLALGYKKSNGFHYYAFCGLDDYECMNECYFNSEKKHKMKKHEFERLVRNCFDSLKFISIKGYNYPDFDFENLMIHKNIYDFNPQLIDIDSVIDFESLPSSEIEARWHSLFIKLNKKTYHNFNQILVLNLTIILSYIIAQQKFIKWQNVVWYLKEISYKEPLYDIFLSKNINDFCHAFLIEEKYRCQVSFIFGLWELIKKMHDEGKQIEWSLVEGFLSRIIQITTKDTNS